MNRLPFAGLDPDCILDAVEAAGHRCDGRLLALNSYENRVWQVGREDDTPLVAKFYRAGRWRDAQILEEHAWSADLAAAELPVVAPLAAADGTTLFRHRGFRYALYPRHGGRWPPLDDPETLYRLGRLLGRIHAHGAQAPFRERPALDVERFGHEPRATVLAGSWLPAYLREAYATLSRDLLAAIEAAFAGLRWRSIRLHGDCHPGNLLWTDEGCHFVDLDDAVSGPAVQDLWMLLSGERDERQLQLAELIEGYREFHDFDARELALIEPLRALRQLHYAAWIARRWDDPAFPAAFPWFAGPRYWEEHVLALRECLAALGEPPLSLWD